MLRLFGRAKPETVPAKALYESALAASRDADLYESCGGRDTVPGRFDMLVLFVCLLLRRLRAEGEAGRALSQAVFDAMLADLDASLREMGVGDPVMGKRMRKLGEAFYGRAKALDDALAPGADPALLADVLARNVLGAPEHPAPPEAVTRLAAQVAATETALAATPFTVFAAGEAIAWPEVSGAV